jgi:hypothetical protein
MGDMGCRDNVPFNVQDLQNLLNHLWMPDTYFVNAKETQVRYFKNNSYSLSTGIMSRDGVSAVGIGV